MFVSTSTLLRGAVPSPGPSRRLRKPESSIDVKASLCGSETIIVIPWWLSARLTVSNSTNPVELISNLALEWNLYKSELMQISKPNKTNDAR